MDGRCEYCKYVHESNDDIISCLSARLAAANLQNGDQAKAIRNVQRAIIRNENREINMGEAWALIREAVGVSEKPKCENPHYGKVLLCQLQPRHDGRHVNGTENWA